MNNNFYLACFRDNVGSSVSFHRKDFKGYTTNIDEAHIVCLEEAQKFYDQAREFDQPISSSQVEAMAVWKVDSQLLHVQGETIAREDAIYIAHAKNQWDGNDLCWLNVETGLYSSNLEHATTSNSTGLECLSNAGNITFRLYESIEPLKRRTFSMSSFNKRRMVMDAGLIVPKHLAVTKRKNSNVKTRFNCPGCGKISWQFNPHDFNGCRDVYCSEWIPL